MLSEHWIIEWVGFWLLGEMRQQWWNYGSHCDGWVKKTTRIVHNLISEELGLLSKPNQSLVQGGRCRTECRQTDQSYFWCFDRWNDLESWDYCSPPGQVGDLERKILESFSLNSWLLQCRYVLWSTRGMARLVLGSVKRRMVSPTGGATSPAGYYHMVIGDHCVLIRWRRPCWHWAFKCKTGN